MHRTELATYEGATGFILDWLVTGFFPNGTIGGAAPNLYDEKRSRFWRKDYLKPCGGERAVRGLPKPRGLSEVEWLALQAPAEYPKLQLHPYFRAYPELREAFPKRWDHQWYALAVIASDRRQEAEIRFCGHDGCRLWWNGQFLFEEHSWHKLVFDLHTVKVTLERGRNSLLLKLDRFGLLGRVTAPGGRRLKGSVRTLSPTPPRPQPPGTLEQLVRHSRGLKVRMPCRATSRGEFLKWKRAARAHYHKAVGPFPRVARKQARLISRDRCDGYTRHRYHLTREAGSLLPVYVLVSHRARFNGRAVICPHGHGQDDKVVAGISPPARPRGNWFGPYTGNYAELLAQAGFLTATWSERSLSHERQDFGDIRTGDPCNLASLCAQAMGMTLPGLHLFDMHGVADFVCSKFGADPRRLGLTGLSGGATMTYQAGAYDDRFKALAPFCGIHSYADYARGTDGCGQQIVPGMYPTLDVGELLCMAAPRPMLLAQGRRDVTFNVFLLQRFARQARKAYRAMGAADRLEVHLYDLAHQVDIDAAIDFFTRSL